MRLTSRDGKRAVRDGVAAHASICQRSGSTNVMETDCREHEQSWIVVLLSMLMLITVRDGVAAHASICQRSGSTNVMETDCREHVVVELDCCVAFDVNAHSAPNMGFEGLKNMETAAFDVNAYSTGSQTRSGYTNVMETDCREHVVAGLDCCVTFDVNAHSAPNMGFEGLKNMETVAFDINAYSTANLCLDGQHGLKNMESEIMGLIKEPNISLIKD
ncbi:hypothetical protein F3Y22_tig00112443pilonHSYRG00138 [Hibiscus syriacus]|uniref:Uncharacterized protein n=1 Tax=Hibiscus syriacus TaxID=106335 RepID=A0A6A2WYJ9_HIBSY|nr:hypothetical protein F3Y22_tig00112443pilonHSYRG00138 [Hibiscus syriacus]